MAKNKLRMGVSFTVLHSQCLSSQYIHVVPDSHYSHCHPNIVTEFKYLTLVLQATYCNLKANKSVREKRRKKDYVSARLLKGQESSQI